MQAADWALRPLPAAWLAYAALDAAALPALAQRLVAAAAGLVSVFRV